MDIVDKLNGELLQVNRDNNPPHTKELEKYKELACHYARIENAISVLSDMRSNVSYIYYGGFSKLLGVNAHDLDGKIYSIWEEKILGLIHPDDLYGKYLNELRFFHFVKHQPQNKRANYYLANELRMKDSSGHYFPTLHRLFYIYAPSGNSIWLALCLYTPLTFDLPHKSVAIDSTTGQTHKHRQQAQAGNLKKAPSEELHRGLPNGERLRYNIESEKATASTAIPTDRPLSSRLGTYRTHRPDAYTRTCPPLPR